MGIEIGDILGDYEVTGVLGRGGMGKVFRVRSLVTEREEAMKVVLPDLNDNPALADRFLREIKVHASLQHPNIAALHTALRIGERLVMILELVEGDSLEEILRRGALDTATSVRYLTQVLAALGFAHERGVIHRDIKPANMLIAAGGTVKLTDFGIARPTGASRLTGTGLALGTLAYMSPEQIVSGNADARSDLYALGLTGYEMLTGRRPMEGDTEHALMNAQLHFVPPEPMAVNAGIPRSVSAAIMRALAKDPALRFQTAREFELALGSTAVPAASAPPTLDLSDVEAKLARAIGPIARRLVADAAARYRTVSEIREALALQIEDPRDRAAFLKTNTTPAPNTVTMQRPAVPVVFDAAALDRLTQALAAYLGPIAKVVVTRAARAALSTEELENTLAAEIPDAAGRARFLAAIRGR